MGQSQSAPPPGVTELVAGAVYELKKPPEGQPEVEIVFLHGLQMSKFEKAYWKTWRARDKSKTCWPQSWFDEKYPNARILSLSYNSSALQTASMARMTPKELSETLLEHMLAPKAVIGQSDCPLIFVCHSLGGLIAKQIVVCAGDARHSEDMMIQKLLRNLKAFFFFATPHSGSKLVEYTPVQLGMFLKGLSGKKVSPVVDILKVLNEESKSLHTTFIDMARLQRYHWILYVVAEGLMTSFKGICSDWVVESTSAECWGRTNFVIHGEADHSTVCKPKADTDKGFQHLMKCIGEVVEADKHNQVNREVKIPLERAFGIEKKLQDIRGLLESEEKKVSIIGLVGMGGAGKTTFSKFLYNSELRHYKKSSYLEKVASRDIQDVQKQLFGDLFPNEKVEKCSLDKIKQCLEEEKVLVVVDDVEPEKGVLEELQLLGGLNKSKVIVTCRDEEVLMEYGVNTKTVWIERVEGIKDGEGSDMNLFCHYAFQEVENQEVRDKFKKVATDIVDQCQGLPLSLEVIGQYLCEVNRKEKNISHRMERWNEALQRLRRAQNLRGGANDRLWSSLQISYDMLFEEIEQEMFLAIVCIFSNISKLEKRTIGEIYMSPNGIEHLIQRSLVKVSNDDQTLSVHNQLRDMGRKFVRDRAMKDLSRQQSYLWEEQAILEFLQTNETSTTLCGLSLVGDRSRYYGYKEDEAVDKIMVDKSCQAEAALKESSSKGYSQLALLHLSHLKTPHVVDYCLFKSSEEELRWLRLVHSMITVEGLQRLWSLKGLRVLQILHCEELEEIPASLGNLIHLVGLEISGCLGVKTLPDAIGNLKQLKILKLEHCGNLLTVPAGVGRLPKLEYLSLQRCFRLESLCDFESSMDSLQELYIHESNRLQTIKGLSNLHSLRILSLDGCRFLGRCDLLGSLGKLSLLETLSLHYCWDLSQEVADALMKEQLHTAHLKVLKLPIIPESLPPCPQLKVLHLENGLELNEFPCDLFNAVLGLEELVLEDGFNGCLKDLPDSLWNLVNLRHLSLWSFTELMELPEAIKQLSQLQSVILSCCWNLVRLPVSLGDLPRLSFLSLYRCEKLHWGEESQRSLREKLISRGCNIDID